MKRIEILKKLNKNNLIIKHLSKGCFLVTDKKIELKATTFNEWKKYLFNYEEAKKFIIEYKGV